MSQTAPMTTRTTSQRGPWSCVRAHFLCCLCVMLVCVCVCCACDVCGYVHLSILRLHAQLSVGVRRWKGGDFVVQLAPCCRGACSYACVLLCVVWMLILRPPQ